MGQERAKKKGEKGAFFEYDIFICHASEDKKSFVRKLAEKLISKGIRVWYDEFTLTMGDSLRRKIDYGLSKSRYGVVVLSKDFFRKEWPQKELDGLVAREDGPAKVILPVWHGVTREEVQRFSPILAGRLAVSSDRGVDYVVDEIMRAISSTTEKHVELHDQNKKVVVIIMSVFLIWVIMSPYFLRCMWTGINTFMIPVITLVTITIKPVDLKAAVNSVLFLHIVNFVVLYFTSVVCGIYQMTMALPSDLLILSLVCVNTIAAALICRWQER